MLSRRDEFAKAAMQAMMSTDWISVISREVRKGETVMQLRAILAREAAEALIAELDKTSPQS